MRTLRAFGAGIVAALLVVGGVLLAVFGRRRSTDDAIELGYRDADRAREQAFLDAVVERARIDQEVSDAVSGSDLDSYLRGRTGG